MFLQKLVISVFLVRNVHLLALPFYITPCSLSDPEFEKCALSTAKNFFQHIQEGDKDLKIPRVDDIKLPPLYYNNSKGINFNITNCSLTGFETMTFLSFKKIPDKNRIETVVTCHANLTGHYIFDTTVEDVKIAGEGFGSWFFDKATGHIGFEWQVNERDGVKYTDITKVDLNSKIGSQKLVMGKEAGCNLNELLSQYGDQILPEMRTRNEYYAMKIFFSLTKGLFTSVPYEELFLE